MHIYNKALTVKVHEARHSGLFKRKKVQLMLFGKYVAKLSSMHFFIIIVCTVQAFPSLVALTQEMLWQVIKYSLMKELSLETENIKQELVTVKTAHTQIVWLHCSGVLFCRCPNMKNLHKKSRFFFLSYIFGLFLFIYFFDRTVEKTHLKPQCYGSDSSLNIF